MTDIVARAEAALEGITPGPWRAEWVEADNWYSVTGAPHEGMVCPEVATVEDGGRKEAEFIAAAPALVRELADEVKRLREAGKTLGKIIDDSLADVVAASGSGDLINEGGDGDWQLVWERLAELRPERDQLRAAVDRVRAEIANIRGAEQRTGHPVVPEVLLALGYVESALDGTGDDQEGWSDEIEDAVFTAFGDGVEWASRAGDPS